MHSDAPAAPRSTHPLSFFTEVYKTRRIDPEGVWHGMCCDTDAAKAHCKIFLQWYTKNSGRWEVCLGPEEYAWTRTIKTTVIVTEVWKCLVVEAHSTVLLKKRKEDSLNRRRWVLSFVERDRTGPVAEISRVGQCLSLAWQKSD
jgi:hypothetical protein